ncbi:hypothetical protein [Streptosporangium sp. 'caverna']|uniref:hypothetical protein n=1 Tax=Streptosporangium sp. 'caverna' TaxID=2202249 RepID=UPI0013A68F92|nr:hypothetical protein [Streptosporangium sp. 'caverna']
MPTEEDDPLWSVWRIAEYLDVYNHWVLAFAREYGLDLFDIGGGNLRARQSDVIRFALRNSRAQLGQPDSRRQERADDSPTVAAPPAQKPPPDLEQPPPAQKSPADLLRGFRPQVSQRGRDFDLFRIGALAVVLNRATDTVRQWEKSGVIPATKNRTISADIRGTRRRYTRAQILGMHRIAQEEGVLEPYARRLRETQFVERVRALFTEDVTGSDT